MADMFAPLVAQLKANPKTIVFTEGNDPVSYTHLTLPTNREV